MHHTLCVCVCVYLASATKNTRLDRRQGICLFVRHFAFELCLNSYLACTTRFIESIPKVEPVSIFPIAAGALTFALHARLPREGAQG